MKMKMKIITVMIIVAFIFSLMPQPYVIAQTIDQCEQTLVSGQPQLSSWENDAGLTPDNNFYFMDKFGDWIKLRLFSFTKDARINTLLDQAQERIGELERLQRQNNLKPSYVNKIVENYNNIMIEIGNRLSNLQNEGVDITDIMSKVTVLSAKNKTIIAGIMTSVSAQNYNMVQSAYNQSGYSFCEVVDNWVNRENQCNDTILLTQASSNAFNNIAKEIAMVGETSSAIDNSYEQVSSYLNRVENISADINNSSDVFDGAVSRTDLSFADKEQVLNDKLDDFRGDYFYLLNNQPQVDTAIRSIISYKTNNSYNGFVARVRANAALLDVALNNAEVGADIAYIESVMSANLSEEKNLDDLLNDLQSAKESSLQTEINTLSSLVTSQQNEIDALVSSKEMCNTLKSGYVDILDRLDSGRFSQARNGILALKDNMNKLDSTYLSACGMMPTIETLYDILINGNALDPTNSCSSQSYIDSYVDEIVAWGEGRIALWETMLNQHDGIINELSQQLGSYEMISTNKANNANSLDEHFTSYKSIDASSIASIELQNIQSDIDNFEVSLQLAENDIVEADNYKNQTNVLLQETNNSYFEIQTAVNEAEADLQTADTNMKNAEIVVEQTRIEYQTVEKHLEEFGILKNDSFSKIEDSKRVLQSLEDAKIELENSIDKLVDDDLIILKKAELKSLSSDIMVKQAEVDNLQSNYNKVLADYSSILGDYNNKEDAVIQADSTVNATTEMYAQKENEYNTLVANLNSFSTSLEEQQAIYDSAITDYNEAVVLKDIISSELDNRNNAYNNALVKTTKLEVIKQELDSFVIDKLNSTVSNYRSSVESLNLLNNEWKGVAFEYNEIADDIVSLRSSMNNTDLTSIKTELNDMKTLARNLENVVEYNVPAQQINSQLETIGSLVNMRIFGQARIDNIKASVQTSVVNLQNITCSEAEVIYNQGITDVCNNFLIGDYLNTCNVINNLETQIVSTCQLQPVNNCGNTIVDNGEQCDDGNKLSGDGCSALCQTEITSYCGDGRIQQPNSLGIYEECENYPPNNINGDGCSATCQNEKNAICGDGILQHLSNNISGSAHAEFINLNNFNEQCDDGNEYAGDGCNNICQLERGLQRTINIRRTIP